MLWWPNARFIINPACRNLPCIRCVYFSKNSSAKYSFLYSYLPNNPANSLNVSIFISVPIVLITCTNCNVSLFCLFADIIIYLVELNVRLEVAIVNLHEDNFYNTALNLKHLMIETLPASVPRFETRNKNNKIKKKNVYTAFTESCILAGFFFVGDDYMAMAWCNPACVDLRAILWFYELSLTFYIRREPVL